MSEDQLELDFTGAEPPSVVSLQDRRAPVAVSEHPEAVRSRERRRAETAEQAAARRAADAAGKAARRARARPERRLSKSANAVRLRERRAARTAEELAVDRLADRVRKRGPSAPVVELAPKRVHARDAKPTSKQIAFFEVLLEGLLQPHAWCALAGVVWLRGPVGDEIARLAGMSAAERAEELHRMLREGLAPSVAEQRRPRRAAAGQTFPDAPPDGLPDDLRYAFEQALRVRAERRDAASAGVRKCLTGPSYPQVFGNV